MIESPLTQKTLSNLVQQVTCKLFKISESRGHPFAFSFHFQKELIFSLIPIESKDSKTLLSEVLKRAENFFKAPKVKNQKFEGVCNKRGYTCVVYSGFNDMDEKIAYEIIELVDEIEAVIIDPETVY